MQIAFSKRCVFFPPRPEASPNLSEQTRGHGECNQLDRRRSGSPPDSAAHQDQGREASIPAAASVLRCAGEDLSVYSSLPPLHCNAACVYTLPMHTRSLLTSLSRVYRCFRRRLSKLTESSAGADPEGFSSLAASRRCQRGLCSRKSRRMERACRVRHALGDQYGADTRQCFALLSASTHGMR